VEIKNTNLTHCPSSDCESDTPVHSSELRVPVPIPETARLKETEHTHTHTGIHTHAHRDTCAHSNAAAPQIQRGGIQGEEEKKRKKKKKKTHRVFFLFIGDRLTLPRRPACLATSKDLPCHVEGLALPRRQTCLATSKDLPCHGDRLALPRRRTYLGKGTSGLAVVDLPDVKTQRKSCRISSGKKHENYEPSGQPRHIGVVAD